LALQSACIAVHGSYNTITKLSMYDAGVGVYFGREVGAPARRHTSFNKLSSLYTYNCDLAIASYASEGHYYNKYEDLHLEKSHISIAFFEGDDSSAPGIGNNNRNTFNNVRSDTAIIGFWLKSG